MKLSQKEIDRYAKIASESFSQDPIYKYCCKNEFVRKRFIYYIMYLRINASNKSDIIITDKDRHGLCIWRDYKKSYTAKDMLFSKKSFGIIIYFPILIKLLKMFKNVNATEIYPENTLLIEPVFVDKKFQGQGTAKRMILQSAKDLLKSGYSLGLETQNPENIRKYEKTGFELISKQQIANGKITDYYMILKNDK